MLSDFSLTASDDHTLQASFACHSLHKKYYLKVKVHKEKKDTRVYLFSLQNSDNNDFSSPN